jgi:lipopolysaccharide transport system ATP-binding protein
VAFADVERFLDTPVKRYSSGMYVRLAFAVAAHLESEILIVDEVLAVGDSEFQKKCIGKMDSVSKSGRTVLFVSHNLLAIQKLCNSALLLRAGELVTAGSVDSCLDKYIAGSSSAEYSVAAKIGQPMITEVKLLTEEPRLDRDLEIAVKWRLPKAIPGLKIGIGLNTIEGQRVFDTAPEDFGMQTPCSEGDHEAVMRVPANSLAARTYSVSVGIWQAHDSLHHVASAFNVTVVAAPVLRYAHQPTYDGLVCMRTVWTLQPEQRETIARIARAETSREGYSDGND